MDGPNKLGCYITLSRKSLPGTNATAYSASSSVMNKKKCCECGQRFQPGVPNGGAAENCLGMWYENGNWDDVMCTTPMSFHVCEIPTASPPTPPATLQSIQSLNNKTVILFCMG
jgi:hypothetical protein